MSGSHHSFAKSEYFKPDRNEPWNKFNLSYYDHRCIHHASTDAEVSHGKTIAKRCREQALRCYRGKYRDELIKIMKARYGRTTKTK